MAALTARDRQPLPVTAPSILDLLTTFAAIPAPMTLSLHDYDGSVTAAFNTWAQAANVEVIARGGDLLAYLNPEKRTLICVHDMRVARDWRPGDGEAVANG